MSRKASAYENIPRSWHIEQSDAGQLSASAIEVEALKKGKIIRDERSVEGRSVRIVNEKIDVNSNTEERAHQMRKIAMGVLSTFGIESIEAELVLAELIQNAHRYSYTGPIWVSIVAAASRPDRVGVTVANEVANPPKEYPHEADDTHGYGVGIIDQLSEKHGTIRKKRVFGAYALLAANVRLAA